MEHDQEYLDFLRKTQPTPEWAMYFSMLEDAIKSFLGDLKIEEFLHKFNCFNGDYIDAMFWIFDINDEKNSKRPKFDEVFNSIFPDIDPRSAKNELQKRVFDRIQSYCTPSELESLTSVVVQKFGEVLKELDQIMINVKKRHEANKKIRIKINHGGDQNETAGTNVKPCVEVNKNETTSANVRRRAEPSGDDPGQGDHGVAEGDVWIGSIFGGIDGGGIDSADGGGADGGIPTGASEPRRTTVQKISAVG